MAYDGFGAYVTDHYPIRQDYPGTLESPQEISVVCSCGKWSYESIASAGGGCDTNYMPWYEQHLEETE